MEDKNRSKAIDLALASIEKEYGKGSIMRLNGETMLPDVQVVSTGSIGLDIAKPLSTDGKYRLHLNITPKL